MAPQALENGRVERRQQLLLHEVAALGVELLGRHAPGVAEKGPLHALRIEEAQRAQQTAEGDRQQVEAAQPVPAQNPAGKAQLGIPRKEGAVHVEECDHGSISPPTHCARGRRSG